MLKGQNKSCLQAPIHAKIKFSIFSIYSTMIKALQTQLYDVGFDSEELCPLIRQYIGHFKRRYLTNIEKNFILGLAVFHLLKELFQLTQVTI
jgi:hypothetical protein